MGVKKRAAGIDVGGTWTKVVAADASGRVLSERRVPTEPLNGPEAFLDRAASAVAELEAGGRLEAVGIGVAGLVETGRGILRMSPNLAGWRDVRISRGLTRRLRRPVAVANDANAAAWALFALEARRRPRVMAALTLGTGVGGGLVIGGRIHEGAFGFAGELGHATVVPGGEPCACGNRGCLEAYAGGRRLVRRYLEGGEPSGVAREICPDLETLTPRLLARIAERGDSRARGLWDEAGKALAVAIHSLACVANPDVVFLTGGVSRSAPLFMPALQATLASMPFSGPLKGLKLRVSRHPNPGALGAALLALES